MLPPKPGLTLLDPRRWPSSQQCRLAVNNPLN
jgi:hypothetical protein